MTSKLDKSRVYTFSVPFFGFNSLICKSPKNPEFYYCGSFSKDGNDFVSSYDEKDTFLSLLPKEDLLEFLNSEELLTFVKRIPKNEGQGVLGIQKTNKTPIVAKIYNKLYKEEYDKRLKQNELLYEYLNIRLNDKEKQTFIQKHKELTSIISEYDLIIRDIAINIFELYQEKFVQKVIDIPTVHPLIWRIMRTLHNKHIEGRKFAREFGMRKSSTFIVTQDAVNEEIDSLSANDMRRLILNFIKLNPQIKQNII